MIHPQAIVEPGAKIGNNVTIGPWTYIASNVEIGDDTKIASHVVLKGPTKIGKRNKIFQFSTIGEDTPDLKYKGEETYLEIGDDNTIREGVTIHRGTVQDKGFTKIGHHNLLMAYVHIGHDCIVADHCVFVNNAAIAGHVIVGDWVVLSGYTLVHQYCHLGPHSYMCMASGTAKDVPAFVTVYGNPAEVRSINLIGMQRRGFTEEDTNLIKKAYRIVYRKNNTLEEAMALIKDIYEESQNKHLLTFLSSLNASGRGIVR